MSFSLSSFRRFSKGAGRRNLFASAPLLLLGSSLICWAQAGSSKAVPFAERATVGPPALIVLPPAPLLDEDGKQRLDPDGRPMFQPAVAQQRDERGHPLFDVSGKPVMQTATDLGFDEAGKKIPMGKERTRKTLRVSVVSGTLTVDGLIGRAALNYEISDFKYVYFYAPWVGTVVVSNVMFPGATEQQNAFAERTLTVSVSEHTFQLSSEEGLLGKKPLPAYVLVDRTFQMPVKTPLMGYGATSRAPYAWPGARFVADSKNAPPVPESLRPTLPLTPCAAGPMHRPGIALPGEAARDERCVPTGLPKEGSGSIF